jgi:hypothetical protein
MSAGTASMIRSLICRPFQYGKTSARRVCLVDSLTWNGVLLRVASWSRSRSTQSQLTSGKTGEPRGVRVFIPTMSSPS